MFMKKEEKGYKIREQMRGGAGSVIQEIFLTEEQMPAHYRLLSEFTLNPGCSIGDHKHEGECEVYYALSGEGVLNDNGTECVMHAGDINVCYDGLTHGIENRGEEPFCFLAFIVKND